MNIQQKKRIAKVAQVLAGLKFPKTSGMSLKDLMWSGDEPLSKEEYAKALRRNVTDAEYDAYVKKFGSPKAKAARTKRRASTLNALIVKGFARAVWANGYMEAVDAATGEGGRGEHAEVCMSRSPCGAGSEITDYVPDYPAAFAEKMESIMVNAWGVDDIEHDCAAFEEVSGKDKETYGWYLGMQELGHGVGLGDYHHDTILRDYASKVEHTLGYFFKNGDRIMFSIDGLGAGSSFDIDVTDEIEDYVIDCDDRDQ